MIKPLSISTKSTSTPQVALRTWSKPHQWPRRAQFAGVSTTLFLLLLLYISHNRDGKSGYQLPALLSSNPRCPNDRWSNGRWVQRDPPHLKMASSADVYKVSGFTGCSMTKENWIHLSHENMTQWSWRSRISTYDWTPGRGCDVAAFDKKEFILRMLKKGGWLMVGDETTEQQFISLSCLLHPYVRAGPFFARHGGWKKSWPEFLYLNLQDKWIQSLLEKQMPLGFNPAFTPIISYTRADLLFSKPELADVGAWTSHPTADPSKFWGPGDIFTQSALDWLDAFEAKFPAGRYATLILSSGTYWTPAVFKGLGGDAANVLRLWRVAMNLLAARMVAMLDADKTKTRIVIFRSAVQGHENCTEPANRDMEPLTTYRELKHNLYNWPALPLMNDVLETIVKTHNHPRMHFLRVERPAQLRVDAHPVGDCSRYVVGAGILEDWNIYMNHYELWEVDRSR